MIHSMYFYFRATLGVKGSIAIVKKFDIDFFMIFGSPSLPESKNVFYKKCLCVRVRVCLSVCLIVAT